MSLSKRFPIKADSDVHAYLLPSNRGIGSIPWDDAIPVIERWYPRYLNAGESFEKAMERLASDGGLDHAMMDSLSNSGFDPISAQLLSSIDWRKNFIADASETQVDNKKQFSPRSLSEHILFSTIRIQTFSKTERGYATGFLFKAQQNGHEERLIITNRHVFMETEKAILSFHISDPNSTSSSIPIGQNFDYHLESLTQVKEHSDSEIDLCALSFDLVEKAANMNGKKLHTAFLTPELVPSYQTLDLIPLTQEVFMFGYPIGLWDSYNQLPIVRRGSLASHPALDYCGKPTGAVDIAAFPGSSGSPIFVLSDGGPVSDKLGNVWGNRRIAVFLGVLTGAAQITATGSLDMLAMPVQHQQVANRGMIPIHLGSYIKSNEVVQFASQVIGDL